MWVEKHRPRTLDEIVDQKDIVGSLGAFASKPDDMPHLLFAGSPGVGKTTAAVCIIVANNMSKIIAPIQSRCAVFRFVTVPKEDIIARLAKIAKDEGAKFDDAGIESIYEHTAGDLRHAINTMQAAAAMQGGINDKNAKAASGLAKSSSLDKVLKLSLSGKAGAARDLTIELLRVYGMSGADILRNLNAAVNRASPENAVEIVKIISEYDYRILVGASPEIQLSAMLYELAALGSKK